MFFKIAQTGVSHDHLLGPRWVLKSLKIPVIWIFFLTLDSRKSFSKVLKKHAEHQFY